MTKSFDLLSLYARYSIEHGIPLNSSETAKAFVNDLPGQLNRALSDPRLLHGQRTEAMFEALIVALGRYKVMNVEDSGRLHPAGGYRAADFRIVLEDGDQWLVEVKNIYEADPWRQSRRLMTPSYLSTLDAYARATGAALKVAAFWARWAMWTLVSPDRLVDENGYLKLEMCQAIRVNEMARLGDRIIATRPPIRLRFTADASKPNMISSDGHAQFTIGEVSFLCEDRLLTTPVEKEIAWIFLNFGDWIEKDVRAIAADGKLEALEFAWMPEEKTNQGFEFVGTLSQMFARYYALQTIDSGRIKQIRVEPLPDWFGPLAADNYASDALPLWRFVLQPANE